ncbi:hemerythrin domain-containing protein [Danxiaibacter flavus]|uniref:Hemerythrin domain-containing protein n=1 Tax=Danxiaibacter flavus TaxID=3049108 RepID=A0ABV3ZET7_9BACT|nr:hemerythrin domain-containing protein [Chitinophagaceae bacterium DXS]
MKRNQKIVPLSRDHHSGLLFCWKIRQGLTLGADISRIRNYVLYYWEHHLLHHFKEEEKILFILKDNMLIQKAVDDHQRIETLIDTIKQEKADTDTYQSLASMVNDHIRYEERELFPYLEETLSQDQLMAIGEELQRLHAAETADNYEDHFWVKTSAKK